MNFKKFLLLVAVLISIASFAQKNNKSNADLLFDNAIKKYHNSLKYLDYNTAINALQEVLIISPEKVNYKDSLLALYYNAGKSKSAVLLAQEMELEGNKNPATLEVLARTFQNAGMLKEALPYFEKLNIADENLYYLYQIATIQFNLTRLKECSETLTKILKNPEAVNTTINMDYEKEESQQIPYAAAAYNISGVMAMQFKETEQAKENFLQALKISPNFLLAKNNLSVLNK